jgi:excisionase family DNA binding protein
VGNDTVRGLLREYADYLTPEEVAEVLEISLGTVYKKLQSGDLAGFQLGRQWRVPPAEVEKLKLRESR